MEALQPLFDSCEYNQIRNNMKVKLPAFRNLSVNATIFKNDIKTTLDDIEDLCIFTNKEYMEEAYFQSENYTKCPLCGSVAQNDEAKVKGITPAPYPHSEFVTETEITEKVKTPFTIEKLKAFFNL